MNRIIWQVINGVDTFGYRLRFALKTENPQSIEIGVVSLKEQNVSDVLPTDCGMRVESEDLQSLCDVLFDMGFKPKGLQIGKDPELFKAIENNLNDLRYILRDTGNQ